MVESLVLVVHNGQKLVQCKDVCRAQLHLCALYAQHAYGSCEAVWRTAAGDWQWGHFHGYSFTYCVFISSGQASMKHPLWIKLLLWSLWPCRQLSAARLAFSCLSKGTLKAEQKMRAGFFRVWAVGGIALRLCCSKLQNAAQVKQDTPEHCTYLTCVHNAFHNEIWLSCTSNHFTIPGSNMSHWYTEDGPKKKKMPDCCHTKL